MVSEKVGGAEGTKLDDDFRDLERVRGASFCGLKRETSLAKAVGLAGLTHSIQTKPVRLPVLMFTPHLKYYIILCWFRNISDLDVGETT